MRADEVIVGQECMIAKMSKREQAEHWCREIEKRREDYERTGQKLPHYVVVLLRKSIVNLFCIWAFMGALAATVFWLCLVEPTEEEMVLAMFAHWMTWLCLAALLGGMICRAAIAKQSQKEDVEVYWSEDGIAEVKGRLRKMLSDLSRYDDQMNEARDWIEAIRELGPIISEEFRLDLKLTTHLDDFKAEVVDRKEGCPVHESFDLSETGYADLVVWIVDMREDMAEREQKVKKFKNSFNKEKG